MIRDIKEKLERLYPDCWTYPKQAIDFMLDELDKDINECVVDVKVDGTSVVSDDVASIVIPKYGKREGTLLMTGVKNNWVMETIQFSVPFKYAPLVSISLYNIDYSTNWGMPMLKDVTQNGFTVGWYNASEETKRIYWQAFGEFN